MVPLSVLIPIGIVLLVTVLIVCRVVYRIGYTDGEDSKLALINELKNANRSFSAAFDDEEELEPKPLKKVVN